MPFVTEELWHSMGERPYDLIVAKWPEPQASIDAVLNPPPTGYLYFVSRGDGTSEFTSSLAEHNRAVARWQLKRGAR